MEDKITKEKLEKYLAITKEALEKAKTALNQDKKEQAELVLDMATRYYQDTSFFIVKDDFVTAFAAINYAHGWLDAGARLGLFKVNDSRLFTVDSSE